MRRHLHCFPVVHALRRHHRLRPVPVVRRHAPRHVQRHGLAAQLVGVHQARNDLVDLGGRGGVKGASEAFFSRIRGTGGNNSAEAFLSVADGGVETGGSERDRAHQHNRQRRSRKPTLPLMWVMYRVQPHVVR